MKYISDNFAEEVNKLLSITNKIVIVTHANPDADAIGSSLGLYNFLLKKGQNPVVITPNSYPEFLWWMPGNKNIINFSEDKKTAVEIIDKAQIIFYVDFNETTRIDKLEKYVNKSNSIKIIIDHHPLFNDKVDYTLSNDSASSAAELVFEFFVLLNNLSLVDEEIAKCIFAGIMADTGCFSYNSSSPRTFEIVAELLKFKINKDEIVSKIYDNFSSDKFRLLGYCLNDKLTVYPEYHTAIISLTKKELENFNFKQGDDDGFVNYPLSIKGIVFSAFFIEKDKNVKISFRSKGSFATNKFARENFNGGGHLNASGGKSNLSFEKTIENFVSLLPKYKNELDENEK
ncbi:MAG: bifunctional oligoribonuclease/PAP phosphatase NrnA [Bacteroidales bacterium]|nr:bifunctional oligoribonuclease/PAP phosphatase NrnA [Bacteroidales bacterium]